ncbi:MAG: hypothetical protein HY398_00990 [Candidatus Doudnabacteria bacterium]|nr:hypothetical protein [Candidatus Doudnabacteria bacterium]
MRSLAKYAGLPMEIDDDDRLVFGVGVAAVKPNVREFITVKNYLKNPLSTFPRREVYFIYRDVRRDGDAEKLKNAGLQYDLTVLPPGRIGNEFIKTIGHYHPYKPGTRVRYPEVYEVIHGRAFFILQSASDDFERLREVYVVEAGRGEKVLVPPGFGHMSINPTPDALVLANLQARGNHGLYEPYESHHGAAFYMTASARLSKSGRATPDYEFTPNLAYNALPPLQHKRPRELPQYNLLSAIPMYFSLQKNPASFDFLRNPESYLDELTPEKLFR